MMDDLARNLEIEKRITRVETEHVELEKRIKVVDETEQRALKVAREELSVWKETHNGLLRVMRDIQNEKLSLSQYEREHKDLSNKIERVEKILYIGIGAAMMLNVVLDYMMTLRK